MILTDPPLPEFVSFVGANSAFWHGRLAKQPQRGAVLVELIHNNASMLALNILVARYVADFLGCEVIGATAKSFTGFPVPLEQIDAFARSFAVDTIEMVEDDDVRPKPPPSLLRRFFASRARTSDDKAAIVHARLEHLEHGELRSAILALTIDEVWIGDLVYDSYLYETVSATIERYDDRLRSIVERAFRMAAGLERLFRAHEVRATVVSHTMYLEFGLLTRISLKHGIPVYGKDGYLDPIGIRLYRTLAEAPDFAGHMSEAELGFFRTRLGPELQRRADAFFPPRQDQAANVDYLRYAYGTDKREEEAGPLAARLGIDPAKKTCAVMAHMFTDAAHCYPDSLFEDYLQWLDGTLAFAARTPEINWLVRQHPYEIMLGQHDNFRTLINRHLHPDNTIRLVDNAVTTSSLFPLVDAVTTVNGTAGIEFASVGIPCILAGNPFYGDLGFAIRPATRAAYFAALASIPGLSRLSPEQIQRAKEAAFIKLNCMRVSSCFVPYIQDLGGRDVGPVQFSQYWREMTERIGAKPIEDDPLYRNLRRMLNEGRTKLLNFEYA